MKKALKTLSEEQGLFDLNTPFTYRARRSFETVFNPKKKQLSYSAYVHIVAMESDFQDVEKKGLSFLLTAFPVLDPSGIGEPPSDQQIKDVREFAVFDAGVAQLLKKINPQAPPEVRDMTKFQILQTLNAFNADTAPSAALKGLANVVNMDDAELIPQKPALDKLSSISLAFYIAEEIDSKLLQTLNTAEISPREKSFYISALITDKHRQRLFPRITRRLPQTDERALYGRNLQAFKNALQEAIEAEIDTIRTMERDAQEAKKRNTARLPRPVTTGLKKNIGRADVTTPTIIEHKDLEFLAQKDPPAELKRLMGLEGTELDSALNAFFYNLPFVNWEGEQSICYIIAQNLFRTAATSPSDYTDRETTGQFQINEKEKTKQRQAEKGVFVINAKAYIERYLKRDLNTAPNGKNDYFLNKYRALYMKLGAGCPIITPNEKKGNGAKKYIAYWAKSMLAFEIKKDLETGAEYWYFSAFHGIRYSMALDESETINGQKIKDYLNYDEIDLAPLLYLQERFQDRELDIHVNDCVRIMLNLKAKEKSIKSAAPTKTGPVQISIPMGEIKKSTNKHRAYTLKRFKVMRDALATANISLDFIDKDGGTNVLITSKPALARGKQKPKALKAAATKDDKKPISKTK